MLAVTDDYLRRRELSVDDYFAGIQARDITVLAKALTLVESNLLAHQLVAEELLARLLPHTGQAIRIGITGLPGVGKSTFIEAVGLRLVREGKRVAVLAVDPSSGTGGGSILGDKTRMARLSADEQAFIRPSPSAGTLGGVACKTRESMYVCEAAGYDVIIVETVGVGQSEIVVADMTDCCLALFLPGAGDELQAIKRGLLERVDVIAVNKADGETRQAAQLSAQQLGSALNSSAQSNADRPPVLTCSALNDEGVGLVWQALEKRHLALETSGELSKRRQLQNISWLWRIVDQRIREAIRSHPAVSEIRDALEQEVFLGIETPARAARNILEAFGCPSDRGGATAED